MEDITIVDIASFLQDPTSSEAFAACQAMARNFKETGITIIRDPRVTFQDNSTFIDLMEKYFNLPTEVKLKDTRPQHGYQVGPTPDFVEIPRDHTERIATIENEEDKPIVPKGADAKWRYFWRIGERPTETKFPSLNAPDVVPEIFADTWAPTMNRWGSLLLQASETVARMAAIGLGMPEDSFSSMMKFGPHLLAPTGSDLYKHHELGTVLAGYHYDLNFITCHGKSRFPGLFAWLRNGKKIPVRVPDGCLLLQAGKQFEYITGGDVLAGFHEVVVTEDTLAAVEKAKQDPERILWRVSSTLFAHIAYDQTLQPLGPFATPEAVAKYPPILAGDQVSDELKAINLMKEKN